MRHPRRNYATVFFESRKPDRGWPLGSTAFAQLSAEPGACIGPAANGGPFRDAERWGGLFDGPAAKNPELHDVGRLPVDDGELRERLVEVEDVVAHGGLHVVVLPEDQPGRP